MKYPVASLNKLMEVFRKNILYGYDIKCALEKILLHSSLANCIKELNLQGVVPAFHGHAHNQLCQVQHHSKYKFHRHKALDKHFHFADMDKYANLFKIDIKCHYGRLAYDAAGAEFCRLDLRENCSSKEIGNVRCCHTHAAAKCDEKQKVVEYFECQMEIDEHWGPDHPERIQAQSHITHRLFFKALDDVERLVVMQLLEPMNLQMNGYKLCTQISKAFKSHATAIRNALQCYNKYAAEMLPPCPLLEWNQIVKYLFLAEFDLLCDSDRQIQTKWWANPLYRQASVQ
ncbi:hypothetical protein BDR07DRAFT_1288399 [Suillus spraguei]|nr:hypothetical protein BDR07DRAFT_1288399 [Suillus spraguei]